jgi:hypothetical protein
MHDLTHQRCWNHEFREAVARCPECRHYFCRECVTEHEDRVLCSACLGKLLRAAKARPRPFDPLVRLFHLIAGLMVLWLFFYYVGQVLVALPTSFHEGTLWQNGWWGNQ